jgi:hypothetical protein
VTRVALELNDAGILAAQEGVGLLGEQSPGVAMLDGDELLVGRPAHERRRLRPRHSHERFWGELDRQEIGSPFPAGWSRADLAHAHLSHFSELLPADLERVLLSLPGSFSHAQLSLLVGICQSLDLRVTGLVDAPLAAVAREQPPSGRYVHIEIELHRAVLTTVVVAGRVEREQVLLADDLGAARFRDTFAHHLARLFVRQTRFDPQHSAQADQQLHLALPQWLSALAQQRECELRLSFDGSERRVDVNREQVLDGVAELYGSLAKQAKRAASEAEALFVSARVAALPGLREMLENAAGIAVLPLPEGAGAIGALARAEEIELPGPDLHLVTRLGGPGTPHVPPTKPDGGSHPTSEHPAALAPSHLLLAGHAHEITASGLALGVAPPVNVASLALQGDTAGISRHHCTLHRDERGLRVEDHSTWGTFVNDQPISGSASLHAGDRLRLGTPGIEMQIIAMAVDNGAT